ncbi:hypothetical protein [uncultured Martelella sp.]|uniref:hypothetical protein n=1 Tax=uncultured Martelella sp. TaxID=392331 RepID=UPI0029C94C6F|nr:hypothetical protein [uncultured Martelella sp.]
MFGRLRAFIVAMIFLLGLVGGAGTAFSYQPSDMASCDAQSVSIQASADCGKSMIHTSCLYHGACGLFLPADVDRRIARSGISVRGVLPSTVLTSLPTTPEIPPPISAL